MAMKYLGETFDLHAGGIDLIFPHHEDEIAQSEAATGKTFARCWCHGEFLLTDGTKMAKRVGNVANVKEMRDQKISGTAYRHFVFNAHYRQQLNLGDDSLEQSRTATRRNSSKPRDPDPGATLRGGSIHVNELVEAEDGLAEIGESQLMDFGFRFIRLAHRALLTLRFEKVCCRLQFSRSRFAAHGQLPCEADLRFGFGTRRFLHSLRKVDCARADESVVH